MSKNAKIGEMKLFKAAIKADVKLSTKLYGVTHLLEIRGVPSHFDLQTLIETKKAHLKWSNRTGLIDFFWSRDSETIRIAEDDPSKFKVGECGPMLMPNYTGKNFYSSSKVPNSNFVIICDPESTHMYVPTDWYMLAVYDGITPEMLDEMDREQLRLVAMNKSLSQDTRDHLKVLLGKGK
jgi:hypothetical protein